MKDLQNIPHKKFEELSVCEKCGANKGARPLKPHKTEYQKVEAAVFYSEVLKRTCWRCGYSWYEETLGGGRAK